MQHHKSNADRHSYCMKCDLDFPSQQTLHLHKIMSDRHFACPECCLELRSEPGLEVHMRNNHHEGRQVACMGCGSQYKSASAVIKHIEDKECPILSLPDKTRKGPNYDRGTASVLSMGRDSPGPPSDDSSEDQDSDGGVLLDVSTPRMEGKRPVRDSNDATTSRDDWPELGVPMTSVQGQAESITTESTGGIVIDDVFSASMRHGATEQLGQAGPSGSALTIRKAGASGYGRPCRASAHHKIQGMDPERFWNADKGRYYCNCGASFLFLATFKYHLTMKDDDINETFAALVAHMEARYSKCAFRVTAGQIEQELSEVTRGLADISPMIGDEMEPGEVASDVSSQPEHNSPGPSLADVASLSADDVSSNPEAVSSYEDDLFQEGVSSHEDEVSSKAEAVSSNGDVASPVPGDYSSHVESLADDLEGLVFSDTHDEEVVEEEYEEEL
ncbi:Zinc finger, C2H2 [Penicillium griseofulvum]|uniref:Zinc finger, C2H2 n=1 Tax=Penicillium patulum TaxID=5078 RepID=A0A135LG63_PENPA|nr:Zinc finger, C2H2 [Penicillium griseofulvum]KXG47890.1 Zinc finger, C2H2 [Penicillium griseofulvum]